MHRGGPPRDHLPHEGYQSRARNDLDRDSRIKRVILRTLRSGPVVRRAPNERPFNTAQSWKDIYGFRPGHKTFIRSNFFDGGSCANRGVHSIVSERGPENHGLMRKLLSHAFSERSLSEQEDLVTGSIGKFMDIAQAQCGMTGGWDIVESFRRLAFDIIGNLAFGQTFGGLVGGAYFFGRLLFGFSFRPFL